MLSTKLLVSTKVLKILILSVTLLTFGTSDGFEIPVDPELIKLQTNSRKFAKNNGQPELPEKPSDQSSRKQLGSVV